MWDDKTSIVYRRVLKFKNCKNDLHSETVEPVSARVISPSPKSTGR